MTIVNSKVAKNYQIFVDQQRNFFAVFIHESGLKTHLIKQAPTCIMVKWNCIA